MICTDSARPVRPEHPVVSRQRLNRRLDDVVNCGSVMIHAGAGYGKTTLLRDWISDVGTGLDVLSIELTSPNEDELAERLATELQPPPRDGQVPDLPSVVEALGDVARMRHRPIVLMVDEPGVPSAARLLRTLARCLAQRPPELLVVVAGREVDVSDWRGVAADRRPVEIDERDLRFDDSEARQLFALLGVPDLSDDEVLRMRYRTRGWAMGLSLGARAGQIGHDAHSAIDAEHDRLVHRYLDNEVVPWPSTNQLDLLETTAILRRLDARLCDLVLDRTDSAALLADLIERSCLVEPVSVDPPLFTVHPMFAQHLRARRRAADADAESVVRTRAIDWCEDAGQMDEAIDLALDEPKPERAVALIKRACGDRIRFGHADLVVDWLERLPTDVLWNDVALSIVMARAASLTGDPLTGRAVLRTVKQHAGGDEVFTGLGLALAQLETSVRFWEGRLDGLGRAIDERRSQFELCQNRLTARYGCDRRRVPPRLTRDRIPAGRRVGSRHR